MVWETKPQNFDVCLCVLNYILIGQYITDLQNQIKSVHSFLSSMKSVVHVQPLVLAQSNEFLKK